MDNNEQRPNKFNFKLLAPALLLLCILCGKNIDSITTKFFGSIADEEKPAQTVVVVDNASTEASFVDSTAYTFRKPEYLTEHFEKHGEELGYKTEEEYLAGANAVINKPNALHKLEAEDNDHIYYIEATNEIVFLSQDGYIRTYFICSGKDYYDRQ